MISKVTHSVSGFVEYIFSYGGCTYLLHEDAKALSGVAIEGVLSEKSNPYHDSQLWFYGHHRDGRRAGMRGEVIAAFLEETENA